MTPKQFLVTLLSVSIFLQGCSSPEPRPTPVAPVGLQTQIDDSKVSPIDRPRALSPDPKSTANYNPDMALTGSGADMLAFAALIGAMKGLGQVFSSGDAKSTSLAGTCQYGDPENVVVASPCINVRVQLFKNENEVLATTSTNQYGDFKFYIPAEQKYQVQVADRKGRTAVLKNRVGRGDSVLLFLKP